MLPPATLLGQRYRLERPLARGGMGTVYQAVDQATERLVAVKQVLIDTPAARLAFEREAHLLAQLDHPALPAVVDYFGLGADQFLVMSFIPGADLGEQLTHQAGSFAVVTVCDWADQLLDLLTYLHTRQPSVVHRDIKPRNLKLSAEGRLVLLDFGLAKGLVDAGGASLAGYTIAYAPLEQLQAEGTEPRSDLYALAATLYELLARRLPADALQRAATLATNRPDPLLPLSRLNPAVPPAVAAVIGQALALRPPGRPATARAMQAALREALAGPVTLLAATAPVSRLTSPIERPSGTIALLATEMVAPMPTAPPVLARHDSLLRAAVDRQAGFVFRNGVSGLSAAFATADTALAAALAAQRMLLAEPWPAASSPRVRMVLHAGSAELTGDEYVGPALPRLTRLLAVGHGGQILLSRALRELMADRLPAGLDLRDLGDHRLPDLPQPERLYQLVAADLPADFPPLISQAVRATGLPAVATPLIGREAALTELCQCLRQPSTRLVTLTGPGGIGKTRLALAAAEALLDDFADGVYFVPLATLREPALVVATLAQILGLREGPGQSLRAALAAELRERRLLLLLDNFEQVLAAALLVGELLATAAGLKVLVTSRTPLRLAGEYEFAVPPLAFPSQEHLPTPAAAATYPAVALFVERARLARGDFRLTVGTLPAVAGICARLDGLPLAIELAAARASLFTPAELLAHLTRRLPLLAVGGRDLPARHQTLRATLAWSYELLEPGERRLFACLGVFAGGGDLEAIEAVCATPDDSGLGVVAGLAALTDQSLLGQTPAPDGTLRYTMLETVREYAADRLAAGAERQVIARRHAVHFLALAEAGDAAIAGPAGDAWLTRLAVEHDNLRAALAWLSQSAEIESGLRLAAALWRFWQVYGHLTEGRDWLEQLLTAADGPPSAARARALVGAGALAWRQHDRPAARRHLMAAVAACRATGASAGLATALKHLGLMALYDQPPALAEAAALLAESLDLRRALADQDGVASCLNDLAGVAFEQGDFEQASRLLTESLAICRSLQNRYGLNFVLHNLSLIALEAGQYDRAAVLLHEGLTVARTLGSRERLGCALWAIACVAAGRGRAQRAAWLYGGAEALGQAVGAAFSASELATLRRVLALARAALPAVEWAAAEAAGHLATLDELLAEAEAETASATADPASAAGASRFRELNDR